jgi:hypothetical protein
VPLPPASTMPNTRRRKVPCIAREDSRSGIIFSGNQPSPNGFLQMVPKAAHPFFFVYEKGRALVVLQRVRSQSLPFSSVSIRVNWSLMSEREGNMTFSMLLCEWRWSAHRCGKMLGLVRASGQSHWLGSREWWFTSLAHICCNSILRLMSNGLLFESLI